MRGADANARDAEFGQTPLVFAVSAGQVDAMKALIKRGADVNLATKPIDLQRQSATDRTASTLRRQILTAMVAPGAQATPAQVESVRRGRARVLRNRQDANSSGCWCGCRRWRSRWWWRSRRRHASRGR
jgi:hypothetical protein